MRKPAKRISADPIRSSDSIRSGCLGLMSGAPNGLVGQCAGRLHGPGSETHHYRLQITDYNGGGCLHDRGTTQQMHHG